MKSWQVLAVAVVWAVAFVLCGRAADAEPSVTVRGQITRIRPAEGRLTLRTNQRRVLTLHVDNKDTLSGFKAGTRVQVTYRREAGTNHVLSIRNTEATAEEVRRETKAALDAIKSYTFRQKDEYQKKLRAALDRLDERIADLKERAQEAGEQARKKYAQQIDELKKARQAAGAKLDKIKAATAESWEEMKAGASRAVDDLRQAYERARARWK